MTASALAVRSSRGLGNIGDLEGVVGEAGARRFAGIGESRASRFGGSG